MPARDFTPAEWRDMVAAREREAASWVSWRATLDRAAERDRERAELRDSSVRACAAVLGTVWNWRTGR